MNKSIITPIILLGLTFVVLLLAFACPGPTYTLCRAAFAPLRHYRRELQTSRGGGARSEQTTTGGQEQQQHQQQSARELEGVPKLGD